MLTRKKVIEELGQGGMGEVYLAEDSRLDRKVALKIPPEYLSERAELRKRFERELVILLRQIGDTDVLWARVPC